MDYHVCAMLEKYYKLQPKPKTTDELKAALQTIWEKLTQERVNHGVANFTKRLLQALVTSNICSNAVYLQVCILISAPTSQHFSEPPTYYC